VRVAGGGRGLERLAGTQRRHARPKPRWRASAEGADAWSREADDEAWLHGRVPSLAREALQQTLLFPLVRTIARPAIMGADDLLHVPQPAVLAPNHSSDIDTPLVLSALPRSWRAKTVVGAAADRFYRTRKIALATELWINTFPFDRSGELRGLAAASIFLRDGYNVLLYPQGTRSRGQLNGFRTGVGRLCVATQVPLIPIHVGGTSLLMPKGRGLERRGHTTVQFGCPLFPGEDETPAEFTRRASEAIAELSANSVRLRRVQSALQNV
jgi:1-acyl-sn-glycerol-3-phosphate acyltransferase